MTLQKVHVPMLERLALADLAQRRGESEEQTLASIIREAVRRECQQARGPEQPQEGQEDA